MRIVHTSDWHAGRLWKRVPRLDELARALGSMADFVEREAIDLVLMTGDVFDNGSPHPEAERMVFEVLRRLGRAAPVVVIAGNHDDPRRLEAWGTFAELANVRCVARPQPPDRGGLLRVPSRDGREVALVAPIPFAPLKWFVTAAGLADETEAMSTYARRVAGLAETYAARFTADTVNILMAHAHVEGAKLARSERAVHLGDQWAVTPQQLPTAATYTALGHIHKPQAVRHAVEYAGSPLQLDFGEEGEDKSFVVVEAAPGVPATVERVRYEGGRPLVTFSGDWAALEAQAEVLARAGHLRVFLELEEVEAEVVRRVRELVPNAVSVQLKLPEVAAADAPRPGHGASAIDLYRAYYERRYKAVPDPALVEAFQALWQEVEGHGAEAEP